MSDVVPARLSYLKVFVTTIDAPKAGGARGIFFTLRDPLRIERTFVLLIKIFGRNQLII